MKMPNIPNPLNLLKSSPKDKGAKQAKNQASLEATRHSLAHLLAAAVLELYPDTKPTIGPAIENGFYYDFEFATPITDKDLAKIEAKMRELLPSWSLFTCKEATLDEAKELLKGNEYKLELVAEIVGKGEKITLYTCGGFTDLCRGGHVENPSKDIAPDSFKLSHIAGAYWRGDEKNKMLTRIYGLAFESKEALDKHATMQEEAKKRDHKILGPQLDLFVFSDLVGGGLPLWTPRGTMLRNLLDDRVWRLRKAVGYEKVEIPHITKKELYIKSGHWDKFKDELFRITTREGHEFAMKPMNCPHHAQIFNRRMMSYRDMPQRYANTTTCYRDEQSGELAGLSRVRAFAQDDAHVFARMSQAKQEFLKIWDIVEEFYAPFGFEMRVRLSLRDPEQPAKYLGKPEQWEAAQDTLREIAKERKMTTFDGVGEAAFYGPKLDFMAKDAIGREWQVATIQFDFNQAEPFELTCVNEKGEKERIVMVHAAIMGSIERFLSILIEHTAGNFPFWLAPVQVKVLPITDTQKKYAEEVQSKLLDAGIRSEIDTRPESLGRKIRDAKMEKLPYLIVIGEKEQKENTVTLESRAKEGEQKGESISLSVPDLLTKLAKENKV